jgi:putative oxidoreductase
MPDRLSPFQPHVLGALRIMTGLLFLAHGLQKMFNFPAAFPFPLNPLLTVAGVLEVVGGVLIVLGLLTRPTAFVLSGFAAAAYFIGHATQGSGPS